MAKRHAESKRHPHVIHTAHTNTDQTPSQKPFVILQVIMIKKPAQIIQHQLQNIHRFTTITPRHPPISIFFFLPHHPRLFQLSRFLFYFATWIHDQPIYSH